MNALIAHREKEEKENKVWWARANAKAEAEKGKEAKEESSEFECEF